jgi:hypothetical protein
MRIEAALLQGNNILAALRVIRKPPLAAAAAKAFVSINKNFFVLQRKAARGIIHIPVANVEHPLDAKIPFSPEYVGIYMDFTWCWIRALAFLLRAFGRRADTHVQQFLHDIDKMYTFAACVYSKYMSTTRRPRYTKSMLFRVIYLFDPHLMCIPSLHVMVAVFTYTAFRSILRALDTAGRFAPGAAALYRHAVGIIDSILFVKQHSVNCVAAGMYAMHCFSPGLFPREEAEQCAAALLRESGLPPQDADAIRAHIITLFNSFVEAEKTAPRWDAVLVDFLANHPCAPRAAEAGGQKKDGAPGP